MEIRIEKTKNPKQKPDWNKLVFGKVFSDHMFFMDYNKEEGWHNASIVPYQPLLMDPANMTLHYGQAIFEGLKAYKTDDGRAMVFRPEMNFKRMNISGDRMCIPAIDVDFAVLALKELIQIDKDWIPTAPDTSLYVRPFIFATDVGVGVHASATYKFMILLSPVSPYYPEGLNPVKILVETEYVRAVRGGIGFTKAIANYAISLKGQTMAKEKGFSQVLWLDGIERKYVEEVGTMNVMFKIDGKIITPPTSGTILAGITRDSVIQIIKSWGLDLEERQITIDEVYQAYCDGKLEEAFGTGTAAAISPIGKLAWGDKEMLINNSETGPIARRLYDELLGMQYGKLEDKFGWVHEV